ncbi:MAG: methylated-DNA--[protein]-cysteine S-methyltransferase [Culicoidibacterales bacterium]
MAQIWNDSLETPIGLLEIYATETVVVGVKFSEIPPAKLRRNAITDQAKSELAAYFRGELTEFTVPYQQLGTDFQQRVWQTLGTIPYGTTVSYSDIAQKMQQPKAVRAIGGANHRNQVAIIIPCHRVIGKNGNLVGYASGIERKKYLLALEQRVTWKNRTKSTM